MHTFARTFTHTHKQSHTYIIVPKNYSIYGFYFADSMIMPSDIAEFLNCPAVSEIKEKALNPSMDVVPADFFDVRDFLLLRLIQTNAQRPMAVRNITQKTIQKAKITSDGWATMTVSL